MQQRINIDKGRTNIVLLSLGYDVSSDLIQSQIRVAPDPESDVLATWAVEFLTDGTDGELVLTLDDAVTTAIERTNGFMDIRRLLGGVGGEPLSVHDGVMEVYFRGTVTHDNN